MIKALTERPDQKPYLSDIRLAIKTGQRPTAIILHDRYAGHRDPYDQYWEYAADESRDTSYTDWDYALLRAAQFIEDYTDNESGQLYWYDQSDRIGWETKSQYSNSQAAIKAATDARGDKGLEPGETIYAIPVFLDGEDNKPTMYDWFEDVEKDNLKPAGAKSTGHDGLDIMDARDARAQKKAAILAQIKKDAENPA